MVGILIANNAGGIVEANDAFLRTVGYSREDFERGLLDWRKLTPPEWLHLDEKAIEALSAYGKFEQYEKEYIRKDGTRVPISVGGARIVDTVDTQICYVVDLTHIRQIEADLKETNARLFESEQHFRSLTESLEVFAWTADASGAVTWWNDRFLDYTGLDLERGRGWGWQQIVHPEDLPDAVAKWADSLASGTALDTEVRLRSRAGEYRWFASRVRPIRNGSGEIVNWNGTTFDIDDQKRMLERTATIAETLQDIPLGAELPERDELFFDACYLPAERAALIGGDWYGVFDLPNDLIGITIGDVAGHGLEASVTTGKLRQTILTHLLEGDAPALVLQKLNRAFNYERKQPFATAFVGIFDPRRRVLQYASAGHPPPMVARALQCVLEPLAVGNVPIGVLDQPSFVTHCVDLNAGDAVVFYTDGLIEQHRDLISGEGRLASAMSAVAHGSDSGPARTLQTLLVPRGGANDDVAILVMTLSPKPRESGDITKIWRFHSGDGANTGMIRRQILDVIRAERDDSDGAFETEVIIGEILANTVRHAPGIVEVRLELNDSVATITFSDSGAGFEPYANERRVDLMRESGRGLSLIASLAKEWSVGRSAGGGSEMTVALPLR